VVSRIKVEAKVEAKNKVNGKRRKDKVAQSVETRSARRSDLPCRIA